MSPTANSSSTPLSLSTGLVTELNNARSTLRTITERNGSTVVLYAGGEVDAGNERTWRRLLGEAATATSSPGSLIVDTSGLDFMGCCAFTVLADQANRCRRRGVGVRLVSSQSIVFRVVAACGLSGLLPIYRDLDSALSSPDIASCG